jgi:hypothetical protein
MAGRLPDGSVTVVEIAAPGSGAANPGFDVTPARLVTGFITERGTCAATPEGLRSLFPEGIRGLDRCRAKWSDAEAKEFVARYAPKGVNADLAVRTYTTRLLGSDPRWCCMAAATLRSRPRSRTSWARMWK